VGEGVLQDPLSRVYRSIVRAIAVAGLLVLLAACGSGKTSTTSEASTSTTGEATTTSGLPANTTPVSVAVTHPTTHLVAVRAARQDGADRVVFEFSEQVPGYKVAWTPKPLMATSGKEVSLAGSAALVVRMEQASGFDLDRGHATYAGPSSIQPPDTQEVQGLARVEDFEAVLTWALGAKTEVPFRVTTLSSPPRLVIDVIG
jgi:hypothetical protein